MNRTIDFDDTVVMILTLDEQRPSPALPSRLDSLFRDLSKFTPTRPSYEIEDEIWALWTNHPDGQIDKRMEAAIAAIAARKLDEAEAILDHLADVAPDWAEVWNKRATVHYIAGNDAKSVRDIRQTLEREPRHFGAIAGFAQICLRHRRRRAALIAYEAALAINPHLDGAREALARLRGETDSLN
jgi:predicted Zn-dependent protease